MVRGRSRPALGGALLLVGALFVACGAETDPAQERREKARADYRRYCALCHGARGEGYAADAANALRNPEFLSTASDEFLRRAIERGRPGTPMSGWAAQRGGPLAPAAVEGLIELIRSWQTAPDKDVDNITVTGVAMRARATYDIECAECHGADGEGGDFMSLNNPEFLFSASDGFLREAIANGRSGTVMKPYAGELTPQTIDDLVVLTRSWQVDPNDDPIKLPSTDLGDFVLNSDGDPPTFDDGRFLKVDALKQALDEGMKLGILDARPGSDYVTEHISGAVSVPFFAPDEYVDQLPKDTWLVAYCGCPHAESGLLVDALKERGFSKLKVLDEGFFVWKDRGYPLTEGAMP